MVADATPFQDVPLGAVFTHKGTLFPNEWWKRVPNGSLRVNKDGTDHRDQARFGLAVTGEKTLCYVNGDL
jgi:hypothetical protein